MAAASDKRLIQNGPIAGISVLIYGELDPIDRRDVYQKLLRIAMMRDDVGGVAGAGRYYEPSPDDDRADDGSAEFSDARSRLTFIDLDAPDPVAALPVILRCLLKVAEYRAGAERIELEFTARDGTVTRSPLTRLH